MKENRKGAQFFSLFVPYILLLVLSVSAFALLYHFDNKYMAKGPQALNGLLILDEEALSLYPVLFLIHSWEYYQGQLLSPEDFTDNPPTPDQYIFIGQYGGLEAGNFTASPHGSASYRLNIIIPEEPQTYMLELPEIFSAYRVYINGRQLAGMGNPDQGGYYPETGNSSVSFEAGGRIEILLAVSDFSHIYSGFVYPPAFGHPDRVLGVLNIRLIFRSILCAAAATIGFLSLLMGFLGRRRLLPILYGLMCLFFVGYSVYPIIKTFYFHFYPVYVIENFSFCAMLSAVMVLQVMVCGTKKPGTVTTLRLLKAPPVLSLLSFGLLACLASLLKPFIAATGALFAMTLYSNIIGIYKWIIAGFITFTGLRGVLKNSVYSPILLSGMLIFDCALIMDRLLPLYEPIITGWFIEWAGFLMVLAIGIVIGKEAAAQHIKNIVMEERIKSIENLYQLQQTYYPLLKEQIEEAKSARHDLRHHFVAICGFLESRKYDKLRKYIEEYSAPLLRYEPIRYSQNDVVDVLARHYVHLAQKHKIDISLKLDIDNDVKVSEADLCSILGNLLENAFESCLRRNADGSSFISLSIVYKEPALMILMENSASRIQEGFLSSKKRGRKGYGLDSIKAIADIYAGETLFRYDEAARKFFSNVTLFVGGLNSVNDE